MIAEKPSLLTRYDNLRRKQAEALARLVDTLGKVDGLPDEQMEQARDALFHADHPYLIVLVGAFNTGKSSLINALIGEPILEVGATPTTTQIAILRHGPAPQRMTGGGADTLFHPAPLLERVSLVDTPGLDSVFKGHDETTRRFLHRADLVLLVMLATQAMSASNAQYLQAMRAYGKRVIVVINQTDLLEPEERETVRAFVTEQGKLHLGFTPEVWLVSARRAQEAQRVRPRDEALWRESGFDEIEQFLNRALSDAERVRQKLETPLQIARNVMTVAQACLRQQQDALAEYRRSADNVRGQIEAALREQEATVRDTLNEINATFAESMRRGSAAIREVFQWSKAFSLAAGGMVEMIGLARFFRRFGAQTPAQAAFEAHKVDEPLAQTLAIADRLGPRLEGRDVKDTDDLILYTRHEIERLPGGLQNKLIGRLDAPTSYDRTLMKTAREPIRAALERARTTEFKRIDGAARNSIVALAVYELTVLIVGLFLVLVSASGQGGVAVLLTLIVLALMLGGLAVVPLRGLLMDQAYRARMERIRLDIEAIVRRAADEQIAYGRRMRQDAVAPFLRMVETQVGQVDALKTDLERHAQALTALEAELGSLKAD